MKEKVVCPVGARLLVKFYEPKKEKQGVLLPGSNEGPMRAFRVLAVGDGKENGVTHAAPCQMGDVIVSQSSSGMPIPREFGDGEEIRIMSFGSVLGVVDIE